MLPRSGLTGATDSERPGGLPAAFVRGNGRRERRPRGLLAARIEGAAETEIHPVGRQGELAVELKCFRVRPTLTQACPSAPNACGDGLVFMLVSQGAQFAAHRLHQPPRAVNLASRFSEGDLTLAESLQQGAIERSAVGWALGIDTAAAPFEHGAGLGKAARGGWAAEG